MKGGAPLDDKCILDPQRDCIGKAEAAKLEGRIKALEEWRWGSKDRPLKAVYWRGETKSKGARGG